MITSKLLSVFFDDIILVNLIAGSAGSNVNGVWVDGVKTTMPIKIVSPQPASSNDMKLLPDGQHVSNFVKTWTEYMDINPRDEDIDPDTIEWDGQRFEVFQTDKRYKGQFYRLILRRVS